MATYTVDQVADTLIYLARERGLNDVSNLKLQKLIYYAQAWNLAFTGGPLFNEKIEAWVHGPVVPQVFRRFKFLGWKPICTEVVPHNYPVLTSHLRSILIAYGPFGAIQLERLTHSEDPWKIARKGVAADVSSNAVILHEHMKQYYGSRLRAAR